MIDNQHSIFFIFLMQVVEKHQAHHKVKMILLRNVDDYGKKGQVRPWQ